MMGPGPFLLVNVFRNLIRRARSFVGKHQDVAYLFPLPSPDRAIPRFTLTALIPRS